ncbi:MAG: GNAT family protein [Pseudoxanthomonas sp.]
MTMPDVPLPQAWRETPTLQGRCVRLTPLAMEYASGLRAARDHAGLDGLWFTNIPDRDGVAAYVEKALLSHGRGESLPFAVLDADGAIVGTTRLYALEDSVPRALIGYTWYAPRVQRTGLNTEAKLLLLQYAFEAMRCICVGFETSTHNARSRTAIARLGAKQDGVLRNHKRHADGSPRDTALYSIIDSEWPQVKRDLLAKLHSHEVSA